MESTSAPCRLFPIRHKHGPPSGCNVELYVESTSAPCRQFPSRHWSSPSSGLLVISGKYSTSSPCRQFLSIHWSSPPSGWWVISGKYICTLQTNLQQILRYSSKRTVSYQWKVHLHLANYSPADIKFLQVDDKLSVESTSAPCRQFPIRHYYTWSPSSPTMSVIVVTSVLWTQWLQSWVLCGCQLRTIRRTCVLSW